MYLIFTDTAQTYHGGIPECMVPLPVPYVAQNMVLELLVDELQSFPLDLFTLMQTLIGSYSASALRLMTLPRVDG